jgi:hypothetical protein
MRDNTTAVIWTAAVLTSALGAAFLFSAEPGINWPLWVAAASVSVVVSRLITRKKVETPLAVLLTWATLLSFGFALSDNDFIHVLVLLSDAMLLGLAIISIGSESWSALSAKLLLAVPFLAPFRVWRATAYQAADAPRFTSSPRSRSLIRGTLLSVPLIIVLIVLFGSADPVIQWGTDRISAWLPDWSFPPRLIFFLFLLSITLGANSISSRQIEPALPNIRGLDQASTVGITEQRMMLWSAAVVLWLFVLLQVSYFIQPPPVVLDSGVTFAEYARRGFGELSFAATIVGAMILVLEYARPSTTGERDRMMMMRLEIALLVALELILFSAFRRVILYEQAYGFTTARLFAQAYMVVMSLVLIALALEVARGGISIAFGRRVAEIALGVFTVLVFWNFEAWIVNRNVDRAVQTGKFDLDYARRLSSDAIPTLLSRRAELSPTDAANVVAAVRCRRGTSERRWFEWNRGTNAKREALRSVHPQPCPAGEVLFLARHAD